MIRFDLESTLAHDHFAVGQDADRARVNGADRWQLDLAGVLPKLLADLRRAPLGVLALKANDGGFKGRLSEPLSGIALGSHSTRHTT
jgi:hypothetical protein